VVVGRAPAAGGGARLTLVDDRGRIFGRFNVVDLALVVFVLILIPAAYAAYVLFKVPAPVITSVEPKTFEVVDQPRVRIRGENLLPYLTAYIGRSGEPVSVFLDDRQNSVAGFLIETPTTAVLDLPSKLGPGRYDIYLYSEEQQLAHLANAFTVEVPVAERTPPPAPVRSVATVRVHYIVARDYAARPQAGDRDRHGSPTLSGEPDAKLLALTQRPAPPTPGIADPVMLVADVRVPVTKSPQGLWMYKGQRIRPGESLAFGDIDYYLYGLMVNTNIPEQASWDGDQ
jgi:hypothetical protein